MKRANQSKARDELGERLATAGLRYTSQRCCVYEVLRQGSDHPTADEVFTRAKRVLPEISHATVYNCLDALVACGLARKVQLERGAVRYCSNLKEHCHYYCDSCGAIFDVVLPARVEKPPHPQGFRIKHLDIAVHGVCAECSHKPKA